MEKQHRKSPKQTTMSCTAGSCSRLCHMKTPTCLQLPKKKSQQRDDNGRLQTFNANANNNNNANYLVSMLIIEDKPFIVTSKSVNDKIFLVLKNVLIHCSL